MDIRTKYYHQMTPHRLRCTLAIDVPSKQDLIEMLKELYINGGAPCYLAKLGIALVNPKDKHYNKRIGRETALKKQKQAGYTFLAVERRAQDTIYKFVVKTADMQDFIEVNYLVHPNSNVVHLQFVNTPKIKRR